MECRLVGQSVGNSVLGDLNRVGIFQITQRNPIRRAVFPLDLQFPSTRRLLRGLIAVCRNMKTILDLQSAVVGLMISDLV